MLNEERIADYIYVVLDVCFEACCRESVTLCAVFCCCGVRRNDEEYEEAEAEVEGIAKAVALTLRLCLMAGGRPRIVAPILILGSR